MPRRMLLDDMKIKIGHGGGGWRGKEEGSLNNILPFK
jgi:hypothetical protein